MGGERTPVRNLRDFPYGFASALAFERVDKGARLEEPFRSKLKELS
jgi:hypothetical protein